MTPPTKVLVVDDEPDVLRSTEMLLQVLGYQAVCLADPTEVVEVAAREKPAVILQDLRMMHLDLPRLLRRLRANPETANIPVILFSASHDVARVAAETDAAGYLAKPFESEQLAMLLQQTVAAPAPPPAVLQSRQQELATLFHQYWNVFTAISTSAQVLAHSRILSGRERMIVDQMDRLLIKIEREAENIRTQLGQVLMVPRDG